MMAQDLVDSPEWGLSTALTEEEERNLAAFNGVFPHWNNRDIDQMLNYYNEDIVWRNVPMGETYRGKVEVRRFLEHLFGGLPDLQLEVTLRTPRGKYVAEEYNIRGTHRGELWGIPPTGRRISIPSMSIVEMREGKLLEDHFYYDAAAILRQMGVLPTFEQVRGPIGQVALKVLARRDWAVRAAGAAAVAGVTLAGLKRLRR